MEETKSEIISTRIHVHHKTKEIIILSGQISIFLSSCQMIHSLVTPTHHDIHKFLGPPSLAYHHENNDIYLCFIWPQQKTKC